MPTSAPMARCSSGVTDCGERIAEHERRPSQPTVCPSPDSLTPSTFTRPPAWRLLCISRQRCTDAAASRGRDWLNTATPSWGSPGASPSVHHRSSSAMRSCGLVAWRRSKPALHWPGMPAAAWLTAYSEPNNLSMNSVIVEEGSVASGDGRVSYAARRRNLACRPLALGRLTAHTKACRSRRLISLPTSRPSPLTTSNVHRDDNRGLHPGR